MDTHLKMTLCFKLIAQKLFWAIQGSSQIEHQFLKNTIEDVDMEDNIFVYKKNNSISA